MLAVAGTRFELVLIDHGFHTDVPEDFRLLYCRLWKALCFSDVDLLLACGRDLGLDKDDSKFLTTALAMFPYKFWAERRCPNFMEVREEFFRQGPHVRRVNARLPKAFHLLSRTNQQIFGYFTYKWGLGPELRMDWLRQMAVYSLVGLRFARDCATPDPRDLGTAPRAFFDDAVPEAEAYVEAHFHFDLPDNKAISPDAFFYASQAAQSKGRTFTQDDMNAIATSEKRDSART